MSSVINPIEQSKSEESELKINKNQILQTAKQVINTEQQAVAKLLDSINNDFIAAVELLINCQSNKNTGRIVVVGIGKSGHIGTKIAASFASLGSPAFFLHAAEALHGDIGMLTKNDAIIALSYSGTTDELLSLIPSIRRIGCPLISITGNPGSHLAKASDIHLPIYIDQEACHLNLAPTASTTATLVLGDALAVAVTKAKRFTEEDFARSHPGGNLGRKLLLKVSDIMITGENMAYVTPDTLFTEALLTMSKKSLGMLAIVNKINESDLEVVGIFTDGDLRRLFNNTSENKSNDNSGDNSRQDSKQDFINLKIKDIMHKSSITIDKDILAADAWQIIKDKKINGLLVTDHNKKLLGMLNIHTLTNAKII